MNDFSMAKCQTFTMSKGMLIDREIHVVIVWKLTT